MHERNVNMGHFDYRAIRYLLMLDGNHQLLTARGYKWQSCAVKQNSTDTRLKVFIRFTDPTYAYRALESNRSDQSQTVHGSFLAAE